MPRFTLHPQPRVLQRKRVRPRFKKRLTRRERAYRIYGRIYDAGPEGITIKQLARQERISISRTYSYLRLIRRLLRKRGVKIQRLDRRFYYVPLKLKEEEARRSTAPRKGDVELRGYVNYMSSEYRGRDIDVDTVIVVANDERSITVGAERIKEMVKDHFGPKVARMLKFGTSPATPQSANHFLFRHHDGEWVEF